MILGFESTILLYFTLAGLFRLLWGFSKTAALVILTLAGAIFIFTLNAALFAYMCAQIIGVLFLRALCVAFPKQARPISWLAFLGLIPFNLQLWFGDHPIIADSVALIRGDINATVAWTAGATFFVIKSFVSLREAILEKRLRILPMLAGLTFVPAFPAGPIYGTQPFRPDKIADRLDFKDLINSVFQIGWGAAAFYVIAPALRYLIEMTPDTPLGIGADIYLGLAALYFDFSGYTWMALALASWFGVKLPPNFNRPFLATSIQNFWQRWHMSLSAFVSTYLYKPFVRSTGSPRLGIFLAFSVVGLWHELSLGYLLWGLGHGAALSLAMKPPAIWTNSMGKLPRWLALAIGWVLTMSWVALLSYIAASPSLKAHQ
ncbi:MAG: MBOAT family O-acyltransferase [Hyphomonadaceae bacterium]|nr:MBOAT family O-acyltransferase [Hyphomonadaceae bacterium]